MFLLNTGLAVFLAAVPPVQTDAVRLNATVLTASADDRIGAPRQESIVNVTGPVVGPLPSASAASRNSVGGGSSQAALSPTGFIVTGHSDSQHGGALNSPDTRAEVVRMAVQFDDTPAYRSLFPAGASEIPIVVTFRLGVSSECHWQRPGDQCLSGMNALVTGTRSSAMTGGYTYLHDSSGESVRGNGFIPNGLTSGGVLPHQDIAVRYATFLRKEESGNTPAHTLVLTMWVSTVSLTTLDATAVNDIALELRNVPATFTLPDGRTLSQLGVTYRFIPPAAQILAPRDFDGNGKSDLFWRNSVSGLNSPWRRFIGTFVPSSTAAVTDLRWKLVANGDFDGDLRADVFWRNDVTGETSIWFMNGGAVRSAVRSVTVPVAWDVAGAGDFNGDGRSDLFWRNRVTGATSVWLMNGNVPVATRTITVGDTQWRPVAVGDFDGDGKADVFWHNQSTGATSIWFMNGGAVGSAVRALTVSDVNWRVAGAGDFNANGRTDLFWRNGVTGETSVWRMTGATINATRAATMSNLNWRPVVFGDFDGDSRGDVFWHNQATGQTLIWYMDAGSVRTTESSTTVPDTNWRVH